MNSSAPAPPQSSSNMNVNNTNIDPNTIQAPTFSAAPLSSQAQHALSTRGTPATLNLDDIFGDCFFTPEGDTVFLSEQQPQANESVASTLTPSAAGGGSTVAAGFGEAMNIQISGETTVANVASRPVMVDDGSGQQQQQYVPVAQGGGISTTGLDQKGHHVKVTTMGPATVSTASSATTTTNSLSQQQKFMQPPQQRHHLQFATTIPPTTMGGAKKRGGASARERKMSDQQKSERRERNREHAKRSRIRKKILLESLQQSVALLKEENDKLRSSIRQHLGDATADELLTKENLANANVNSLIASNSKDANKVLDDPDFSFIKALQTAQQNFVVTDPSLPDNPIVYATQGFLNLTGYALDQVLGRNCRFLQGPETDPKAVEKIRRSIEEGSDMSVCLLNYRVDGTTFWNQFFISALRDAAGNITNYVGVQCKVSDQYAANVCKKQEEEFANADTAVEQQNPVVGDTTTVSVGVADGSIQNTTNGIVPKVEDPSNTPAPPAPNMEMSTTSLDGNGDATMQ